MSTYALTLTSDVTQFTFSGGNYGGIKIVALTDEFEDGFAQRRDTNFNLSDLYEDVEGSLAFRIQGPTASGITEILRRIAALCEKATKYEQDQYITPVYLVADGINKALLKRAELEIDEPLRQGILKQLIARINYVRKGLTGSPSTITSNNNYLLVSQSSAKKNSIVTTSLKTPARISAPTDLTMKLFNQNNFFPSGYILFTSDFAQLVTISGSKFYNQTGASSNPTQARIFNENVNGSFNRWTSGLQTDGVLGFVTAASDQNRKIVTSGVWYIHNTNTLSANGVNAFPSRNADLYATVRTVGNAVYSLKVIGKNFDTGLYVETQATTISGLNLPTPIYLGSFDSQGLLGDTQLQLEVTQTSLASGVLQLDRFIAHGVPDESARGIFVSAFQEVNTPVTASGNILLRIVNNYFPNNDQGITSNKPFMTLLRDEGGSYVWNKTPTYYGDIGLSSRQPDLYLYGTSVAANMTLTALFLATGGAVPTYSGYWIYADRSGTETMVYFDIGIMSDASPVFLAGG